MKGRWLVRMRLRGKFLFDLIRSEQIRRTALQAIPFWIASLVTGLIAVGFTRLFAMAEGLLQDVLVWHGWMIFLLSPFFLFLAWLTVQVFARMARGSGIPQVMAAIDLARPGTDEKVDRLLNFRVILTKMGSCLLMVLGGGVVGREGPTIQI